ncbi:hypothetical protein CEXT_111211 [Caerostris extrusa]|uniref:C2H2-type domain-containing protein n=1 Tax=Caerostris extrusa TaxID=172846 RepID=A0AAV4MZJ7_CAEEX|nr:hypothetical protein CEXT_111211 [Caerostris extrusa]
MKCVANRFKDWLLRYDVLSSPKSTGSSPILPTTETEVFPPTTVPSPTPDTVSFPLVRDGTPYVLTFPCVGLSPVPNKGCTNKFVYLYVPASNFQWRCDSCDISFPSDVSLRNHLTGHKEIDLRDAAPKLSLPAPSTKKSRRRKRIANPATSIAEPSTVTDPAAVLAQPVVLSQIEPCPDDEVSGPLGHFLEPRDDFLSEQLNMTVLGPLKNSWKTSPTLPSPNFSQMALLPMAALLPHLLSTLKTLRHARSFPHQEP